MRIEIEFVGGTSEQREMVRRNADVAAEIMSRPDFIERVRGHTFDNDWSGSAKRGWNGPRIADDLAAANIVTVRVAFYYKLARGRLPAWARYVPGLAAQDIGDEEDGLIRVNTAKIDLGAGSPGNLAHEVMHHLGYRHGDGRAGSENSVPYAVGDWIDESAGIAPNAGPRRRPWYSRLKRRILGIIGR